MKPSKADIAAPMPSLAMPTGCQVIRSCRCPRAVLAIVLGQLKREVLAEQTNVMSVDITQLVTSVVAQSEVGTFAKHWHAGYLTLAREVEFGEEEWCVDAPVVQPTASQYLVYVKVDPPTSTVVEDEVPWTGSWPRVHSINPLINASRQQAIELGRVDPHVEVGMLPSLNADQCVHSPTSTDAGLDSELS